MTNKFDSAWLNQFDMRNAPKHRAPEFVEAVDLESDLHKDIIEELKRRRWYFTHSRTDKRATNTIGTTDFVIAIPGGKTLWLECKRKNGKLTQAQNITRHILVASGHWHVVVYSFKEFLEILKGHE